MVDIQADFGDDTGFGGDATFGFGSGRNQTTLGGGSPKTAPVTGAVGSRVEPGSDPDAVEVSRTAVVVSGLATTLLTAPEPSARVRAAEQLAKYGGEAKEAIPALVSSLEDLSDAVRREACAALAAMGEHGKEAIPSLSERVTIEKSADLRGILVKTMMAIDPASPEVEAVLKRTLVGGSGETIHPARGHLLSTNRVWACGAISHLGPTAAWSGPMLLRLLRVSASDLDHYGNDRVYRATLNALVAIEHTAAIPVLEDYKSGARLRSSHASDVEDCVLAADSAIRALKLVSP
ncbi:HEAT repeat domain-containing protein [Lignipirellula cremea]|uniref:HEAT repeat protein n=1 Tax=Lignipirellula cremea TaxID=2528010 RepID=A0A518DYF8_9BACT|nr:HEAT repeat domain-containing protein [Lignipirellula cremea]QDU96864.1 hypothetical protein Pla8534_46860 [Lignipirellula cremea]